MSDPITSTATSVVAKASESTVKTFGEYLAFRVFGEKMLIDKSIAEAKAELEKKKVLTEGELDIQRQEMENEFALALERAEKQQDYKRMFSVFGKAEQKIIEGAEANIDPDKMQRLKDLSKEFSSDEMQDYIAGILAGEYNKSGTFSLQTMDIIKSLSKEEMEIFNKFKKVIFDYNAIPMKIFEDIETQKEFGITYEELLLLSSLGLVSLVNSFALKQSGKNDLIEYSGKQYKLGFKGEAKMGDLYFLTRSGLEIANLLDDSFNKDFFEYLKKYLKDNGIELLDVK